MSGIDFDSPENAERKARRADPGAMSGTSDDLGAKAAAIDAAIAKKDGLLDAASLVLALASPLAPAGGPIGVGVAGGLMVAKRALELAAAKGRL